jgi:peptide/nickel transport system permease protein
VQNLTLLVNRLIQLLPVLFGIAIVTFLLLKLTPGDPARLLVGDRASAETLAAVRHEYGLDRPWPVQLAAYFGKLVQGDLGDSIRFRKPVIGLIQQFLPPTLFLVLYVMALTIPTTLVLAVAAARNHGSWADQAIRVFGVCGFTVPVFWVAIMLSRLFGVELGWFPVSGYGATFTEHLHHLFLPALTTSIWLVPVMVQTLRGAILERTEADFVTAARSKGLPERRIFWRHILPNALLPTLHLLGVMVAYLIGGTIIVEAVFAVPGLGRLMISSILSRDYSVVQGLTLFFAFATVLVTLLVDIATTLIDPRVRL